MDIRQLGPDDAHAYRELRIEASGDPAFASNPTVEAAISVDLLKQVLGASTPGEILGAFDNGELLGMVGLGSSEMSERGTLFGLFVTQARRSCGVGRALVRALVSKVSSEPAISSLELLVDASNTAAISLYRTEGFRAEKPDASPLRMSRAV